MTSMHVKRLTLTSKKNWWMVELDDEEPAPSTPQPQHNQEEIITAKDTHNHGHGHGHRQTHRSTIRTYQQSIGHPSSTSVYYPPTHPASIFSFPTPTSYSAPPNPTQNLAPCATGSASELFKCIVKKPNVVQMEINDEMQSNARDVTTQFLAELRVYTTVTRHRNIAAFLGSLENVGMVLEFVDGRTLFDVICELPPLTNAKKVDYHNQLLDGLTHLHSFGLSHGDLSLLNIQVTNSYDTIKLLDFGRSVAADSIYVSPDEAIDEPPQYQPQAPPRFGMGSRANSRFTTPKSPIIPRAPTPPPPTRKTEQIHPGTRPFSAPEVLRGECVDALLADAYSFGIILVCLDRCSLVDMKPWEQRKDMIPKGFLDGLVVFGSRCVEYLRRWDKGRRRLAKEDMMDTPMEL
ncbi:kinase-like protein [Cristinia sonorae]|uniref:Kinase-like protein n=1 Tax=Cristinia sonorae TaxID=1940300 RepID=A0A8K0UY20_9AGAR|nr:kinase-like protein [Cristinia sonorae]